MELRSVLIVDDNAADQFLARTIIERFDPNIEVLEALDGEQALQFLQESDTQPDAIFLDINMPVMDGHEFLEAYSSAEKRNAVVVMLSSSEQERDVERSRAYEFVIDYQVKPLRRAFLERFKTDAFVTKTT